MISPCQEETTWNQTGNMSAQIFLKPNSSSLENFYKCYRISLYITPVYIGYSSLKFYAAFDNNSENMFIGSMTLRCIRQRHPLDTMYDISVVIWAILIMLAMGTDLDFQVIKENLRRPKAPIIALISQFTIMPLIAYGVIMLMGFTGGKALGFFTMGCSPGGTLSNVYSKLFNGDLSISVTMTTLSTVASLGMLPLWLFTLGTTIPADDGIEKIKLPFVNILQSLVVMIVPLAIGVLIKYKLPKVARFIMKWLKVMFITVIIYFLTVAIYVNRYMFPALDGKMVASACMLSYGGFLLGGIFAWLCRFDWKLIKTISLETGMQNAAVCVVVVQSLTEQPDTDLAIILPVASAMLAYWPFYIILPIYLIRQKILSRRENKNETGIEGTSSEDTRKSLELRVSQERDEENEESEKEEVESSMLPKV
ncbi:hepatic sodium/bile acid cotransporter-like isoform X2 [Watersipora subatra]